jgi:hypothetical protein
MAVACHLNARASEEPGIAPAAPWQSRTVLTMFEGKRE